MKLSILGRHPLLITWLVLLAMESGAPSAGQAQNKTAAPDYSPIISDFRASIPKLMREQKVPGLAVVVVAGVFVSAVFLAWNLPIVAVPR